MIADSHDIALMDLLVINVRVTHCISDLSGFYIFDLFRHCLRIFFHRSLGTVSDNGCDSLRNGFGRNHDYFFVFGQKFCLICCQNNVFIIRKNVNRLRIYFFDRTQHIFGTRIHGLTAFDQIINAQFAEDFTDTLTNGNGNKSDRLRRHHFFTLFFFELLLFCNFCRIFDQFLLMLLTHIVNFDTGQ